MSEECKETKAIIAALEGLGYEVTKPEVKLKSGWINVCSDGYIFSHSTREKANMLAAHDRIACVYYKEGDGI